MYYFCDADLPDDGCRSPYVTDQLNAILDHVAGTKELLEVATASLPEDASTTEAALQAALDIAKLARMHREGLEGLNPLLETVCKQRARESYQKRNRSHKVRLALQRSGYTVNTLAEADLEEFDGQTTEGVKECKKKNREDWAGKVVNSKRLTQDEGERLLQKKDLTEEQRAQVSHYIFEKNWTGFLDSLREQCQATQFYCSYLSDRGRWLKTVVTRWSYCNWHELSTKDFASLSYKLKTFDDWGVNAIADLKNLKSAFFKFVEDIKLLEVFKVGTEHSNRSIASWLFKLELDSPELSRLMELAELEEAKTARTLISKEFVSKLPKEYISKLKSYFNFLIPATPRALKQLVRNLGYMLARFGFRTHFLKQNGSGDRFYEIADADSDEQKNYRLGLEEILKTQKVQKNNPFEPQTLMGGDVQRSQQNLQSIYITDKSAVTSETLTASEFDSKNGLKPEVFLKPQETKKKSDPTPSNTTSEEEQNSNVIPPFTRVTRTESNDFGFYYSDLSENFRDFFSLDNLAEAAWNQAGLLERAIAARKLGVSKALIDAHLNNPSNVTRAEILLRANNGWFRDILEDDLECWSNHYKVTVEELQQLALTLPSRPNPLTSNSNSLESVEFIGF